MTSTRPRILVVGNTKGGTGKSTVAMHLLVGLMREGLRCGVLDLDGRQGTLSRYLENRTCTAAVTGDALSLPAKHTSLHDAAVADPVAAVEEALAGMQGCEVVVVDTPGSDTPLCRAGHAMADVLVTPLNDSLIDLDVLARLDIDSGSMTPSHYADAVWDSRKRRAARGTPDTKKAVAWLVMRNRLGHVEAHNKKQMEEVLRRLSKRLGFTVIPGFGERVIFRQLFLEGLTMLDLRERAPSGGGFTLSHVAARQEVRRLLEAVAAEL